MSAVDLVLILWALLGHLLLWVGLINRLHSIALPCWVIRILSKLLFLMLPVIPLALLWWRENSTTAVAGPIVMGQSVWSPMAYLLPCWVVALSVASVWTWRRLFARRTPVALVSNHTSRVDLVQALGHRPTSDPLTKMLALLPGNEIFQLSVHEKVLVMPRLSRTLDGLTIAHLSDLHFTGKMERPFYEEIVRRTNELKADLIAVTGDIIDKRRYVDWIPDTLGRLQSRYGTYFVLGNHDKRLRDVAALRQTLTDAGLIDLGGRSMSVQLAHESILMAGNELPWFSIAADMELSPPDGEDGRPFRLLLSHSPDQIEWARARDFDLMLAGHTHGGQICLPVIGPIVSASRYGVKYASGVFYEEPTLLHVSRGVSGVRPIRINCPPEVTKLILHRGQLPGTSGRDGRL